MNMKTKFAIFKEEILTVEVIVMGTGEVNIKVVEPKGVFVPSTEFNKRLLFQSEIEASNHLKKMKNEQ